jgi:4-hydroxy-tetrahydrodipicolinate synthase
VFKGSLIALATPFDADNGVDYEALKRLIDFHVSEGSDGLVIAGTTGESATLDRSEHVELIGNAVDIVDGRLPVIAGTGSNSTAQTIKLSQEVEAYGIDAHLMVAPYYNKPMQEGIFQHFASIADAIDKPVMLYNVPGRTVTDILPETVARLAAHPNIFGIKEATGDMERLQQIQALVGEDFMLYSGDDFTAMEFMEKGGHGVVSVCGNVAPRLSADMCRAALAGESEKARELDALLQPLNKALFVESNPIPLKWALAEMGLISPGIRLPLTTYSEEHHDQMRQAIKNAGISL